MRIGLDLDGTIITCRSKHVNLMNALCQAFGYKLDKERYWSDKFNKSLNNFHSLKNQGLNEKDVKNICTAWINNIEKEEWSYFDSVYESSLEKLKSWRDNGYSLHLISARRNKAGAIHEIKRLGLFSLFFSIDIVNNDIGEDKDSFMKLRGVNIYIGDTEYDGLMAKKANIPFYAVASGMRCKSLLIEKTDKVFEKLSKIEI